MSEQTVRVGASASGRQRAYTRRARKLRPLEDRFFEKVNENGPVMPGMTTPCHVWTGSTDTKGYGHIEVNGRLTQASRVAVLLATGTLPKKNALHHCDNPPCVRYDHLFEGTQRENALDMYAKGRSPMGRRSHLTAELVVQLRQEAVAGVPQKELCRKYNLLSGSVSRIVRGTRWLPKN